MEYITLGDLVTIQERIGAQDPWRYAIVNRSGLLSALATPFQSAFGAEAFPTLIEKAGAGVFAHSEPSLPRWQQADRR
jgi:hypothetical protein